MKLLLQQTGDAKINRKLLKPQVERRRRERMNRSLESLRHLLLQGAPQEGGAQRRFEKAEILENTVHFLHRVAEGATQTEGWRDSHVAFRDGFSACVQRAALYLGPHEGKGLRLRLEATLDDASLVARFASAAASSPASLTCSPAPLSPPTMQLQSLRQLIDSKHGQSTGGSHRSPAQHASLGVAQHPLRPNQAESHSWSSPSLWRPWP
ncbi:hypothetical protein NHX12_001498 [Muraenolepis orangiensis]|uniref:BHLH domain-containing protein n=1 Tax=Muraenolepis orangiensis TaxID=630683 RepID=A0A9Q0E0Z9_9TELE|nr:hypothetical protein NHX12_001498 [Muraenolepis orangiensis]